MITDTNDQKDVIAPSGVIDDQFVQDAIAHNEQESRMDKLKEHLKQIDVVRLQPQFAVKLAEAITSLDLLKEEIITKKQGALDKKDLIKGKISFLKESGKVTIDDNEFQKSELSVQEFVHLLDTMVEEVGRDIAYYQSLLSDNLPSHIYVFKFESDNYHDHIKNKIQVIRKYVKTARRDLSISYSRYCYGFDAHIRQISYVEHILQNSEGPK